MQHCGDGYYDGVCFHRVVRGFVAQGGDPTGSGRGGTSCWGSPFRDECDVRLRHDKRGVLAMANSGKDTNGSQLYSPSGLLFLLGPFSYNRSFSYVKFSIHSYPFRHYFCRRSAISLSSRVHTLTAHTRSSAHSSAAEMHSTASKRRRSATTTVRWCGRKGSSVDHAALK